MIAAGFTADRARAHCSDEFPLLEYAKRRVFAAYSASKAGVIMLARCLALEWLQSGINVNAVCPGLISSEATEPLLNSEAGQRMIPRLPRGRILGDDDLDWMLHYLGSDASRSVTGGTYVIDDGQTL